MNEEEETESAAVQKRLQFGHQFTATYKKHDRQGIKNVFWNPNSKAFVSFNEKNLHVWSPTTEEQLYAINFTEQTKSPGISWLCYSIKHQLYLAISCDFKLHIYNEMLIHQRELPLQTRLINQVCFYEKENKLITAGIDGVFVFQFDVKRKQPVQLSMKLDPYGKQIKFNVKLLYKQEDSPQWIQRLRLDTEQGIVFSWTYTNACFHRLNDGSKISICGELGCDREKNKITDICLSQKFQYFLVATTQGHLSLWKLPNLSDEKVTIRNRDLLDDTTGNSATRPINVHQYKGHSKAITSIQLFKEKREGLFMTASLDHTLRIWCLNKFCQQYCFKIDFNAFKIWLISSSIFAVVNEEGLLKVGEVNANLSQFYQAQSNVKKMGVLFQNNSYRSSHDPFAYYVLNTDNSIQVFSSNTSTQNNLLTTAFPPPRAAEVKQIVYCANTKKMILLMEDGSICVYTLEKETAILCDIITSADIQDIQGNGFKAKITCMELIQQVPPKFDKFCQQALSAMTEIKRSGQPKKQGNFNFQAESDTETNSSLNTDQDINVSENEDQEQFVMFGLKSGAIVFVNIHNLKTIYGRFDLAKNPISLVREVIQINNFVSLQEDFSLLLFKFGEESINVLQEIQMFRPILDFVVHLQNVLVVFKSGDTELFWIGNKSAITGAIRLKTQIKDTKNFKESNATFLASYRQNEECQIYRFKMLKINEHEKNITFAATNESTGHFITGSDDGTVKIWTAWKNFVCEFQLPQVCKAGIFMNKNLDLLLGHKKIVSEITAYTLEINNIYTDISPLSKFNLIKNNEQVTDQLMALLSEEDKIHRLDQSQILNNKNQDRSSIEHEAHLEENGSIQNLIRRNTQSSNTVKYFNGNKVDAQKVLNNLYRRATIQIPKIMGQSIQLENSTSVDPRKNPVKIFEELSSDESKNGYSPDEIDKIQKVIREDNKQNKTKEYINELRVFILDHLITAFECIEVIDLTLDNSRSIEALNFSVLGVDESKIKSEIIKAIEKFDKIQKFKKLQDSWKQPLVVKPNNVEEPQLKQKVQLSQLQRRQSKFLVSPTKSQQDFKISAKKTQVDIKLTQETIKPQPQAQKEFSPVKNQDLSLPDKTKNQNSQTKHMTTEQSQFNLFLDTKVQNVATIDSPNQTPKSLSKICSQNTSPSNKQTVQKSSIFNLKFDCDSLEERQEYTKKVQEYIDSLRPGNKTAVPRMWIEMNYKKIKNGQLHSKYRGTTVNLTRRDVTLARISENVVAFNQPTKKKQHYDIFIGKGEYSSSSNMIYQNPYQEQFSNLTSNMQRNEFKSEKSIQSQKQAESVLLIGQSQKTNLLDQNSKQQFNTSLGQRKSTLGMYIESENYPSIAITSKKNNKGQTGIGSLSRALAKNYRSQLHVGPATANKQTVKVNSRLDFNIKSQGELLEQKSEDQTLIISYSNHRKNDEDEQKQKMIKMLNEQNFHFKDQSQFDLSSRQNRNITSDEGNSTSRQNYLPSIENQTPSQFRNPITQMDIQSTTPHNERRNTVSTGRSSNQVSAPSIYKQMKSKIQGNQQSSEIMVVNESEQFEKSSLKKALSKAGQSQKSFQQNIQLGTPQFQSNQKSLIETSQQTAISGMRNIQNSNTGKNLKNTSYYPIVINNVQMDMKQQKNFVKVSQNVIKKNVIFDNQAKLPLKLDPKQLKECLSNKSFKLLSHMPQTMMPPTYVANSVTDSMNQTTLVVGRDSVKNMEIIKIPDVEERLGKSDYFATNKRADSNVSYQDIKTQQIDTSSNEKKSSYNLNITKYSAVFEGLNESYQ